MKQTTRPKQELFVLRPRSEPQIQTKPCKITPNPFPHALGESGEWGGWEVHVEIDGAFFYVDSFGFGVRNGLQRNSDLAPRRYEMILLVQCWRNMNFQNGFAYFVCPARARVGLHGPVFALVGTFCKFFVRLV